MSAYHWTRSIHHDGSAYYVIGSKDCSGSIVTLKVRTEINAPIEQMFVRSCPDGDEVVTPMRRVSSDVVCQWWEANLQLSMPCTNYRFILNTSEGDMWLTAAGIVRYNPTDSTDFKILVSHDTPSWVYNSVFY